MVYRYGEKEDKRLWRQLTRNRANTETGELSVGRLGERVGSVGIFASVRFAVT